MPKKKVGGKKKTKKGASAKDAKSASALPEESARVRAQHEVAALRTTLAERSEDARHKAVEAERLREQLAANRHAMQEEVKGTMDISADLTRQYKMMQSQLMARIMDLQETERVLREELDTTRKELSATRRETAHMIQEKDDTIASLTQRIQSMEGMYESVLNDALDAMASKVEGARDRWATESLLVQHRNKEALMEFGLSHSVSI